MKGIYQKKKNCLDYKYTHYKRVGNLELFYFDKLKGSKGKNLRSSGTISPWPKKMCAPKVKP